MTFAWRDAPSAEFAVIGNPVKHSLSPRIHQAAYDALHLTYRYVAIQVEPGEVAQALDHLVNLGYIGVNATVPHKEEVLSWATVIEPLAARVRAANTLRLKDRACINTDAPGFLDTLEGIGLRERSALVLGAGGSARAILAALSDSGYRLKIYNRTRSKAESLVRELGLDTVEVIEAIVPNDVSLLLNTTSASLQGEELPIPWDQCDPQCIAYDLMYAANSTPFLRSASCYGLKTVDGLPLLVAQGARAFEWWLNLEAPRDAMMEALRR